MFQIRAEVAARVRETFDSPRRHRAGAEEVDTANDEWKIQRLKTRDRYLTGGCRRASEAGDQLEAVHADCTHRGTAASGQPACWISRTNLPPNCCR